jgi:hypothetical protein
MDTDKNDTWNMFCSPSPRPSGERDRAGVLIFTRHLTPTLSPNSVGGEGENARALRCSIRVHPGSFVVQNFREGADGFGQLRLGDG